MVAKTYYSKITTGITVFTGFVTNIPASGTAPVVAKDELTASIANLSGGYPTGSSIKMFSKVSGTPVAQWAKGYTASTIVSGVTLHGYVRGGATKSFWLKSYTSAGAVHQSGSATAVAGPTTDAQAHIVFSGQSVTVPAGGALVITADYSGTGRMYIGMNCKSNNDPSFPDSMVIELDEVLASSGNISTLGTATLTLTGNAPQAITSDNNDSLLGTLTLTLTGNAPLAVTSDPNTATLASATLTLTGNVPQAVVTAGETSLLGTTTLALTGNAPQIIITETIVFPYYTIKPRRREMATLLTM